MSGDIICCPFGNCRCAWEAKRAEQQRLADMVAHALEEDHHVNGLMCVVCTAASNPGKRPVHAPHCIVTRILAEAEAAQKGEG